MERKARLIRLTRRIPSQDIAIRGKGAPVIIRIDLPFLLLIHRDRVRGDQLGRDRFRIIHLPETDRDFLSGLSLESQTGNTDHILPHIIDIDAGNRLYHGLSGQGHIILYRAAYISLDLHIYRRSGE